MASAPAPGRSWSFLAFEIEKKVNLLALIALAISLATATAQVFDRYRGPKIQLRTPDQVTIFENNCLNPRQIEIISDFVYHNSSPPPYNGVVAGERIKIEYGDTSADFGAYAYVNSRSGSRDKDFCASDRLGIAGLLVNEVASALPFTVFANTAVAHESWSVPETTRCKSGGVDCAENKRNSIQKEYFLNEVNKRRNIKVTLRAVTASGEEVISAPCFIDALDLAAGFKNTGKWASPLCTTLTDDSASGASPPGRRPR